MLEAKVTIAQTKERVRRLQGVDVRLKVNRGRNNFVNVQGRVKELYPAVFTFEAEDTKSPILTFSYVDVLTKNVRIFPST